MKRSTATQRFWPDFNYPSLETSTFIPRVLKTCEMCGRLFITDNKTICPADQQFIESKPVNQCVN